MSKHVSVQTVLEAAYELEEADVKDWLGEAKWAEMGGNIRIQRYPLGEAFVAALKPNDAARLRKSSHYPVHQHHWADVYRALAFLLLSESPK